MRHPILLSWFTYLCLHIRAWCGRQKDSGVYSQDTYFCCSGELSKTRPLYGSLGEQLSWVKLSSLVRSNYKTKIDPRRHVTLGQTSSPHSTDFSDFNMFSSYRKCFSPRFMCTSDSKCFLSRLCVRQTVNVFYLDCVYVRQ